MRAHAWQILTLGVGFTPFISGIRKCKLPAVDYSSLNLVPADREAYYVGSREQEDLGKKTNDEWLQVNG